MKLKTFQIKGFKCYEDSGVIPYHDLTVFIGENDAGKSTILDGLELFLENKSPLAESFRDKTEIIEFIAVFSVTSTPDNLSKFLINDELKVKKSFTNIGKVKIEVFTECFEEDGLNNFQGMSATDLKNLLEKFNLPSENNQEARKLSIETYVKDNQTTLPKVQNWIEIKWMDIGQFLPIFQRYSSSDYGNPESSIRKTLEVVYRSSFYQKNEAGDEVLKTGFLDLKKEITKDLDSKLSDQLLTHLRKYKPEIQSVSGSYDIDFSRGLSFSGLCIVDESDRPKTLDQVGEGSKKKIFLSILEWDAEINIESVSEKKIIRAYDEPDSNLHYDAQRKMFYVISDLANDPESKIQSIICTHSLTMIDRAPAKCVNHVIRDNISEKSTIDYLRTDDDEDIKDFLNQISEISGIKNSNIFYEKCFLLVEGESEQNAIPIMYRKFVGKNLTEDGIILINLQTNGQWSNALKFLHKNKQSCTILLLDNDTQSEGSSSQVTKQKLEEIGFDSSFLESNCFFVGNKEFEDVITDDQYVAVCNQVFKKADKSYWANADFLKLRADEKFSESLRAMLCRECKKQIGKPEIASAVANLLSKEEIREIEVLKNLFGKLNSIIT